MSGSTFRAGARLVVWGLCAALCACGGSPPPAPAPRALLEELRDHPDRVPPEPPAGTPTVLLTVGLREGRIHLDGNAIPVGGTLGLERGMARRRAQAPPYWVVQSAAGSANARYWTPLDPSPRIRLNLPADREDRSQAHELVDAPEIHVALRLPFFPEGTIEFYAADGRPAGSFRCGPEPSAPLVPEDRR